MMGQLTVEHLVGIRRVKRRLGEESPGGEELKSRLQATAFLFAAAGSGKNQRLPQARVELSATEFLPVAGEFGVETRSPWLASQPQVMASHPMVAELEVDQWSVRSAIQFQGAAFPGVTVGFGPHSYALSEGRVELGLLCHSSRLCGHGAAA